MSFGLSMHDVDYVTSYAAARAMYDKAKPRKTTRGAGDRPLPGREKSLITGISLRGDDVVFTYHVTDVVTWKADGRCVLNLQYKSQSSATFANRFAPSRIELHRECEILLDGCWNSGSYYRTSGRVTIMPGGSVEGTLPFSVKTLNRQRSKQARIDSGYAEFVLWYTDQANFWQENLHRGSTWFPPSDMIRMLSDREQWSAIMQCSSFGYGTSPKQFLVKLREYINEAYNCYDIKEKPVAQSYATASKWLR